MADVGSRDEIPLFANIMNLKRWQIVQRLETEANMTTDRVKYWTMEIWEEEEEVEGWSRATTTAETQAALSKHANGWERMSVVPLSLRGRISYNTRTHA